MTQSLKRIDGNSLFGGEVYQHTLNGWAIKWESKNCYRHWCIQTQDLKKHPILIVMQNPGSLSGDGKNLSKDTTLRILRDVFQDTQAYPIIVNLFDYAAANPDDLIANWPKRDGEKIIYDFLDVSYFSGVIFAYGNCAGHDLYGEAINQRIDRIRSLLNIPEITLPLNSNGTPKHPMTYQRQKLKPEITARINKFLSSC